MSFDLNDRKAEGTPCRVWTERDRGAVALGDDQSMQIPAGQWNKPPAQQIGPEWGQAQGLLLHVALPEAAGLMEVEDLCAYFMEVVSKDARVLFSTEYSSGDCLSVEALGLTKD